MTKADPIQIAAAYFEFVSSKRLLPTTILRLNQPRLIRAPDSQCKSEQCGQRQPPKSETFRPREYSHESLQ
jgi:hypothetical protein